jgi:predicted nuclease of predicted toxin-antitoxin system
MFLANENFPRPSTILLREKGFTVKSIQEDSPGIEDPEVMQLASYLNLIILTFDSDYGELIFRYAKDNPLLSYFSEKKEMFRNLLLHHLSLYSQIAALHYQVHLQLLRQIT